MPEPIVSLGQILDALAERIAARIQIPPQTPGQPRLLTAREAAERLAISLPMLRQLARVGEIPVVRIGRAMRFDNEALRAWWAARQDGG